ncbi:uncharacterized protein LOC122250773 isoform X2 [Penaeus japonicus]|uniref:uncharacterized protein LOC122250773 isoform X2 n=1 Tax=Penaeus japonicus TaxID=27405 RepID=UPI001C70FFA6|nr:uncharacterized protein LOC122250773 isoform X2 [Penaeus japonicus]XP_042868317.1 uncharacterized protein LOC122250773 isoform X2 [Penaeus japonicus]XP_042868318.1 uncharacterized protein LOC122250773 isoform X2 [Penaeus japonicus]XP_042868319.1 uncharacterized protein LOC122250773 isoform X2 [Penaeus japonicus]
MQRRNCSRLLPDEEGFPTSPLGSSFPSLPSRDSENGEILGDSMVALRRPPEESPRRLRLHSDLSRRRNQPGHYSLLNQHQQFSGFRIRDALAQKEGLRLRKGCMTYRRGAAPLMQPQYLMCVQMKNGAPVGQSAEQLYGQWSEVRLRPPFRVPRESLPKSQPALPCRKPNTLCVNIWEEFIFGTSALKKKGNYSINEENVVIEKMRKFLEGFLSKRMANLVMFVLYFLFYFISCCTYNNYLEAALCLLFHGHLRLHECAYENNINLDFTGSLFEGPAYVWVRGYCQHCIHKENVKVFDCQMKKMKIDIMAMKRS